MGEGPQRACQDAVHLGDGNAVVGDGHMAVQAVTDAGLHLPFVEHTAAAVDDQGVGREILGELPTGGEVIVQVAASVLFQPVRELLCADVPALPVMGTAL